jgi:3-methyladenine DNA glycosylase AlkD
MTIAKELAALADPTYKDFQAKLVPTVEPERILGVRMPALRKYARALARTRPDEAREFIASPTHRLYDEMNLHGELIGLLAETPQEAFDMLDAFLPHADNWATCDLVKVPAFKRDLPAVLEKIRAWCAAGSAGTKESPSGATRNASTKKTDVTPGNTGHSGNELPQNTIQPPCCLPGAPDPATEYVVRFGVVQLMTLFLDDAFEPEQLDIVARIDRPEYYINMARAWYFSFALIKQPEATLPLFERRPTTLDAWTHNKSLQKARESRRLTPDQKAHLQSLKLKAK